MEERNAQVRRRLASPRSRGSVRGPSPVACRWYVVGDRVRITASPVMTALNRVGIEFVVSQVAGRYLIGHDDAGELQTAPKGRVEVC